MKMLVATVALATLIAAPALGQTRQTREQSYETTRQSGPAQTRQAAKRQVQQRPCAAYHRAWGCLGWDPDPHVRMMIQMDANRFDD